jgi:uncharacterized membrane protein YeaQ/YmgE (transglycosylase-associated protein family)
MRREVLLPPGSARRLAEVALGLAGAVLGAWGSWGFGLQIGGVPMALVASLNGALMGVLLADAVLQRLWPRR